MIDLINTREVQRLRRIRQLGLSNIAYPGAEHSRFVHSLGVAHLMRRFLDADAGREGAFGAELAEYRQLAIASALLHDVGHGPFSHALEAVTGVRHERFTTEIVRAPSTEVHEVLEAYETGFAEKVAQVVERRFQPSRAIVKLLSSQLDLDRTDYLLRDALMTGAGYGTFDVEWMLHVMRLGEVDGELEVGLDLDKGQSIAEDYIMCRYYMYLHVYFHHTTRAAEVMMETLLRRAQDCQAFLPGFSALNSLLAGSLRADLAGTGTGAMVDAYLELDDGMLWTAMHMWAHHADPVLRDLSARLLNRRIFRGIAVQSDDEQMALMARLTQRARDEGLPADYYVVPDATVNQAYKDDYVAPLQENNSTALPTDRVYLFDRHGQPHELADVSFLVRAVRSHRVRERRVLCPEEWLHGES